MPNLRKLSIRLAAAIAALSPALHCQALPADAYASSSALSQGNWAKIEVTETGMQFISDQVIRNLGFADPEKVNVFGYGGVVIPENLDSPDDLPLLPSIRVNGGIVFFGEGYTGWELNSSESSVYSHLSHPYSDKSYYFLSDCEADRPEPPAADKLRSAASSTITSFTERLVHEQDLTMPMNTGRYMLGEDFKSMSSRNFNFNLPGNIGGATITTVFGCKTSGGVSTLSFTANGKQLSSTTDDRINYSATKEIVLGTIVKEVPDAGDNLALTIKYNASGTVVTAALDYIEVEYPRALTLTGSDIYFHLNPDEASEVRISGADGNTRVWNVTKGYAPKEMPVEFNGSTLSFVSPGGYHEYVAFRSSGITRAVNAGERVSNQDIHSMPAPGMLIISPSEFVPAAQRIETLHQLTDGLTVAILTPEEIYNEFSSGKPDVSAFRKLLKMWYDRAEGREGEYTAYCLIMGRPSYDNKAVTATVKNCGYPRIPIWQSPTGETETTSYSTDDYIGMLADVSGTFNIGGEIIHTAVGRMPVKSLNEANSVMDKLEDYILRPDLGAWRNNIMVLADDQDNGVHLEQAEAVISAMLSEENAKDFLYEKLYLDAYQLEYTGVGASYPQAHERLMNKWNEGTAFINYIGHANPKSWGHENMLTWTDINSMSNQRLPILYAATCEFMRWDADDVSGGEVLWLLPNSGVIAMICPSREVLISANGVLNKSTAQFMFKDNEQGEPLTLGQLMIAGKNNSSTGANKLRYGLLGDPSMRLPWPDLKVKVDRINGVDVANASEEDFPILPARSQVKISGHISDKEGNLIEDFNGIAEIALYDAEKVITTNGNGSDGVVSIYNDRKTRLFVGRTKVTDGKWSTEFTMPSEIDNNFSPALLSLYASADDDREANGSSESLYCYGYDETAPDDFDGPKIIEFYLNTPSFVSGNQVSPNPILTAKFYDESGISVSEAGIGHNITLDLDGKSFFDDVAQYYVPDATDTGAGSLTYALGEIAQGDHELRLTVWDNANNSTTATLNFSISALWKPSIETLTTDVNPATSSVNFIIATDGSTASMECSIEVYDIWGKKVWRGVPPALTGNMPRTTLNWNLCDFGGARVQGGVYLYRATIKTDKGATVAKTKKLIVK